MTSRCGGRYCSYTSACRSTTPSSFRPAAYSASAAAPLSRAPCRNPSPTRRCTYLAAGPGQSSAPGGSRDRHGANERPRGGGPAWRGGVRAAESVAEGEAARIKGSPVVERREGAREVAVAGRRRRGFRRCPTSPASDLAGGRGGAGRGRHALAQVVVRELPPRPEEPPHQRQHRRRLHHGAPRPPPGPPPPRGLAGATTPRLRGLWRCGGGWF